MNLLNWAAVRERLWYFLGKPLHNNTPTYPAAPQSLHNPTVFVLFKVCPSSFLIPHSPPPPPSPVLRCTRSLFYPLALLFHFSFVSPFRRS